jgi:dienelactone hydrolase
MKPVLSILILPFLPAILWPAAPAGAQEGDWTGAVATRRGNETVRIHMQKRADGSFEGTCDLLSQAALGLALDTFTSPAGDSASSRPEGIEFAFRDPGAGPWSFKGEFTPRLMKGQAATPYGDGTFHLHRVVPFELSHFEPYAGWYQAADGDRSFVTLDPYGGLVVFDFPAQMSRRLLPWNRSKFITWDGTERNDVSTSFLVDREGNVVQMLVNDPEAGDRWWKRIDADRFEQEFVTFPSGDLEMAGLLLVPSDEGTGPFPALVVVPDEGPRTRDAEREMWIAYRLLSDGIAVLLYDKRGCGASSGRWRDQQWDDLAEDGAAAVRFLKTRPDIDPFRIGLYGMGEGGRLAAAAAGRSQDVAFLISDSAPVERPDGVDPTGDWERLAVPALALYGRDDTVLDAESASRRLHEMAENGKDIEIRSFEAGHGNMVARDGAAHFHGMFLDAMTDWILEKTAR